MSMRLILLLIFLLGSHLRGVAGDLELARMFSDHGVLQQSVPVPVWGRASAGSKVSVEFSGQVVVTEANAEGAWRIELAPLTANPEGTRLQVRSGEETIERKGLLVGEVWYASGQSNMQWTLGACAKKLELIGEVIAEPDSRLIRTMRIGSPDSEMPLSDLADEVRWQFDTPANRPSQSAVAYFFARELHDRLGIPIGIIEGAWGGKPIEGFIPRDAFSSHEVLRRVISLADREDFETLAKAEGGVIIRNTAGRPGRIFHSRVHPVAPYAVAGFVWYQGESNAGRGEDPRFYREKMKALVTGWRKTWGKQDLPFYFVQLPSFRDSATGWIRLREEQRLSLAIEHTGMAVAIDLLDEDIHPSNKVDVGKRLSAWALAKTYSKEIPFSGPLFRSAIREGKGFRIAFEHAESGLIVARKEGLADPVEQKDAELSGFELADQEGNWHPATVSIRESEIYVSSDHVSEPVAVRYACEGEAEGALLFNREGFPASPFCSDLGLLPWIAQP